jgi:hypothetical protein
MTYICPEIFTSLRPLNKTYLNTLARLIPALLLCAICGGLPAQDTTQKIVPERANNSTQEKKPYVIIISVDGFR